LLAEGRIPSVQLVADLLSESSSSLAL